MSRELPLANLAVQPNQADRILRFSFPWGMVEAQEFPQPLALLQSQKSAGLPHVGHLPDIISIEYVGYVERFWELR